MPLSTLKSFLQQHLQPHTQRLVVAYSGGVDSHVLLDALVKLSNFHQRPIKIIHVHHGLSCYANDWADHVAHIAQQYGVDYCIERVQVAPTASLEAAARTARYQAINQHLQANDVLLLAHHQQDQAETLLLRLMRGTGVKGLIGMKACTDVPFCHQKIACWRPLLSVSRQQIMAYAQHQNLVWIEDDSNTNLVFNRNYVRHQVLPVLAARWPQAVQQLAQTSQRMQEAHELLQALAQADYQQAQAAQHSLNISVLANLTAARRHNLFRYWLEQLALPMPDYADISRIWTEVCLAKPDAQPLLYWQGVEVRRYRQQIFAMKPLAVFDKHAVVLWHNKSQAIVLPTGERITPQQAQQDIASHYWQTGQVSICYRQGGEKIRPVGRQQHHDLKTLLQAQGVPTWQRERIPLLYINQQLAAVLGYWVAHEFA
jgi:tRNA(Ile)-lysidine synthase